MDTLQQWHVQNFALFRWLYPNCQWSTFSGGIVGIMKGPPILRVPLGRLTFPTVRLNTAFGPVDTISLQLRLPKDKLQCLKTELSGCIQCDTLFKKELESLVGLLQFATKVVWPGRYFLRRLYSMKDIGSKPNHHVRLNWPAIVDIM